MNQKMVTTAKHMAAVSTDAFILEWKDLIIVRYINRLEMDTLTLKQA